MSGSGLTVDGGSAAVVLFAIAIALATIAVGAWVAVSAYNGYRRSGDRSTWFLAVGIALAAAVHASLRVVLSTAGASLFLVNTVAVAVQFTGLVFVLYAVYGNPGRRTTRVMAGAAAGGALVFLVPVALVRADALAPLAAATVANGVTAGLGLFVAAQAFRGYQRYDRRPMLLFSVGIGLLTVGSFAVLNVPAAWASDALRIGSVLTVEFAGLLSIAASLRTE
ncbi:DUF7521 family protein [Halorubrum lipolyticum]|uniref:Uncharacterized protein n=1 Tax=Halorubrum lipolyticum DSM 21995 TaxID=1227482 RepID=M0NJR7_9EURY|nr:hypothetical protein [Halorubrum lipolyticum]EMA58227.1 hypothetical protein C469_13495 [Halorubrum lipolyticum DSM 21995]